MHRLLAHLTLALCMLGAAALARAEGVLTHMSGAVSVQRAGGDATRAQAGEHVNVGDTLLTGADGYVRMALTDGSEIVLRPNSQFVMDQYRFVESEPAQDSFVFRVLKGGLRTVTGFIGKRGNRDAYKAVTATSTIGIRGTQYDLRVCEGNCGALPDGTYLAVRFGAIETANALGMLTVTAGQVAFIAAARPPTILPRDPGIGFTPPSTIPKLDEKKKAAAAIAPAPAADNASAQAGKPAQRGGGESASASVSESSAKATAAVVTPPATDASTSGPDCVVQ